MSEKHKKAKKHNNFIKYENRAGSNRGLIHK